MQRISFLQGCLWVVGLTLAAGVVSAQETELTLEVRRMFGYGGGSQIQGRFRLTASGPDDLRQVTFYVDEQALATVGDAPFRVDFSTGDYAPGWHVLSAAGVTAGGRELASNTRRFEFITGQQAIANVPTMIGPVLLIVLLAALASAVVPMLANRGRPRASPEPGAPRNYGLLGGTICPGCGRPFALHWWALNLSLVGKIDRCDNCGRWHFVRRASREALRQAEAAEVRQAQSAPAATPEEELRRQLDDSRFSDS